MSSTDMLSQTIVEAAGKPCLLLPSTFSTEGLSPADQFRMWNDRCSSVVGLKGMQDVLAGFHATNTLWTIGHMALSHVVVPASGTFRTRSQMRRDDFDHWLIGFLLKGTMRQRAGDTIFTIQPGQMFHFSLAEAFDGDRTDCDWLTLFVPRDTFRDLAPTLDMTRNQPIDTPLSGLFCDYLLSLERRLPTMTEADLGAVQDATHAMIAACLGHASPPTGAPVAHLDDMRLGRIRQIIDANLKSPTLGPKKLCRLAGISRSHLYRLFEQSGGVARYIQAQRLVEIHAALSDPENRQSIASIAEEFGFTDASTFGRAFRAEFGCRPSDVRAAGLSGHVMRLASIRHSSTTSDEIGAVLRHLRM
jgi:AraC-like DNA-binding protein